jgi:hypothetical protein
MLLGSVGITSWMKLTRFPHSLQHANGVGAVMAQDRSAMFLDLVTSWLVRGVPQFAPVGLSRCFGWVGERQASPGVRKTQNFECDS